MNILSILALLVLGGIFVGCASTTRDDFDDTLNNSLEKIIYYASLAGNSHNTQPWIVFIENDSTVRIEADFSRQLHVVDPNARGLFISIGAFIENFELAASSFGYHTETSLVLKQSMDSSIAIIILKEAKKSGYDLSKIENRRTLRTPFQKKEISNQHLNNLLGANKEFINFYSANSEEGKYISNKTIAAYSQQARNDKAKQELSNWIRFSNSDVKLKRDGLTTSGMGITGIGAFFVRNFFNPEDAMKESFIEKGIIKTIEQTENCGGWIIITQSEDTPEKWIHTGRLYQRLNIDCRDYLIGFHPMNQIIEEEQYEEDIKKVLSPSGKIQFVARIGYVEEYPPANSVRRPVKEFIKK